MKPSDKNQTEKEVTSNQPHYSNRLGKEKSPYLLQHANNPVDWYPWGDEAFTKAIAENKPIFLSIGYATCHWCHVMEHESFEDEIVAKLLNDGFISIKVDREERPDIDSLYMSVAQLMTGRGGWPLTVIMTPDKRPFFAGTYIPKESRFGMHGMVDLLPKVSQMWQNDRDRLLSSAEQIHQSLRSMEHEIGTETPQKEIFETTFKLFSQSFDKRYGGMGNAPKFPTPHNYLFLLRYYKRSKDPLALEMVEKTLTAMRLGGIYDHIGFGFHRYSTDAEWLVPHFEKMLYDQALLALLYLETYQVTQKEFYATVAREIFTYVLRDMTSPEGGFYSAEDADSEGEEGKYYVWTIDELRKLLTEEQFNLASEYFSITSEGNFTDEYSGRKTGSNIPHQQLDFSLSQKKNVNFPTFKEIEDIRNIMFHHRQKRVPPLKDDKVLTDWNGLMIVALARGARLLNEPAYAIVARKAADFILKELSTKPGILKHRFRHGHVTQDSFLDDYAFFIWGLLELYETSFEVNLLKEALRLTDVMIDRFWSSERAGFFLTARDGEKLLIRSMELYDGALPSGNSVAFLLLLKLGKITAQKKYDDLAVAMSRSFSTSVLKAPHAYTLFLCGLDFAYGPSTEIVIIGDKTNQEFTTFINEINHFYIPGKIVIHKPIDTETPDIVKIAPYTDEQDAFDEKTTVYICRDYACILPTNEREKLQQLLESL